jgi:hypothetical protein
MKEQENYIFKDAGFISSILCKYMQQLNRLKSDVGDSVSYNIDLEISYINSIRDKMTPSIPADDDEEAWKNWQYTIYEEDRAYVSSILYSFANQELKLIGSDMFVSSWLKCLIRNEIDQARKVADELNPIIYATDGFSIGRRFHLKDSK